MNKEEQAFDEYMRKMAELVLKEQELSDNHLKVIMDILLSKKSEEAPDVKRQDAES